jgi:hypothetical protein
MQTLTQSDLNFVLMRCPRDIVKLLKANPGKLFLAGGFIRSTISGDKVSDIDLFGTSKDDLTRIAKDLTLERKGRYFATDNAITVLSPPRIPVQFITRWTFPFGESEKSGGWSAERLIQSFDFTVCQAVIWAEKKLIPDVDLNNIHPEAVHKGHEVIKFYSLTSDSFYPDLAARRLVYTFPQREEEAGGSFMRVIKFIKKGYNVQAPTLAGVTARILSKLTIETFNNSIIDQEGKINERWAAKVITGLLRQVDPLTIIDGVDLVDEHEVIE